MDRLRKSLDILPDELADRLYAAYHEVRSNYLLEKWEPSELNGGKLAETVYRVLEWIASGRTTYTPFGTSIRNLGQSARNFVNDASLPDGVRFHVPQALDFLYTLRNKRGVGHPAGDIDPNHMDAAAVLAVSKWVVAEIVRLLNAVSAEEAREAVEELVVKDSALVWRIGDTRRVLDDGLGHRERVLLLLHREHPSSVLSRDLCKWTEYSRFSTFRKNILERCHAERLLEYDQSNETVHLSPKGIRAAEALILKLTSR